MAQILDLYVRHEYWHYEYPFRPPYTLDIGEGGTDNLECWCSLTSSCVGVCSCFIALGASPHWQMSLPPVWPILQSMPASPPPPAGMAENAWRYALSIRQVYASKSTPSAAYLAINAAHGHMLLSTPDTDRLF
eukprot:6214280-Pleurochrysis_carterae.AAC.2